MLHFDFGPSFKYRDYTVTDLILQGFPVSFEVGIWAIGIATVVGVTLGTVAALRQPPSSTMASWDRHGGRCRTDLRGRAA
ncbi:MAG: hypothetical protein MZV70_45650 [Desulfobacterales bacterium]|nr:hypothetical protein [Desulfobacterales bacterium]